MDMVIQVLDCFREDLSIDMRRRGAVNVDFDPRGILFMNILRFHVISLAPFHRFREDRKHFVASPPQPVYKG